MSVVVLDPDNIRVCVVGVARYGFAVAKVNTVSIEKIAAGDDHAVHLVVFEAGFAQPDIGSGNAVDPLPIDALDDQIVVCIVFIGCGVAFRIGLSPNSPKTVEGFPEQPR